MTIRVQREDFDSATEISSLRSAGVGAVVNFLGTVRDWSENGAVSRMELEHYPGMTEKSLEDIVARARARWQIADALVIHRIGPLEPGDQIVLVAVASAHRAEAFAACEFIVDYLKTEAPFWKKETTSDGERWVDARVSDDKALQKWQDKQRGETA